MNILQLLPKLDIGGVERGTVDLALYMKQKGHKAVIVSGGGRLADKLSHEGVIHYKLPIGGKNPLTIVWMILKLKAIVKKENIDIIHARSRIPAITGFLVSRITGKYFVTTAHGQYRKHIMSYVMGWGRAVIVAGSVMERYMVETFGVHPEKIRVIPRGVDVKEFAFNPKRANEGGFTVGMISRITPLKGHDDFIKAVSIISRSVAGLRAYIVGDIDKNPEYAAQLKSIVKRLGLDGIIQFENQSDDVPAMLGKLDLLISANKEQEAFGRILIEAQSVGTACVATRVGGVMDVIDDGITGLLCEPGNAQDIADKALKLYKDLNLRNTIIVNARASVEKNFKVEKMLEATIMLYEEIKSMERVLIMKISSLGDVILCIPSIRAIRRRYPHGVIKVLTGAAFKEALAGVPYIDEVITCDFNGRDSGAKGMRGLGRRLAKEEFDIAVDFQNNRKSHILGFLSGAPKRYGYDNGKFSFLLTKKVKDSGIPMDPIEHQAKVLGLLEIFDVDKKIELFPSPLDMGWADTFLNENWVKPDEPLVAMHLESSPKWLSKRWPAANFIKIADNLAKEMSVRVVVTGTDINDEWNREFFQRSAKSKPINAVGKTTIGRMIALLSKMSVLLTLDSAPMHIAAGVNVPFVALFGPTNPKRHVAPNAASAVFYKEEECAPCYKPVCGKGHMCMKNISVDEVYGAIKDILRQRTAKI